MISQAKITAATTPSIGNPSRMAMSLRQCGSWRRESRGRVRLTTAAVSAASPSGFKQLRRTGAAKGEDDRSPGNHIRRRRRRSRRRHSLASPQRGGSEASTGRRTRSRASDGACRPRRRRSWPCRATRRAHRCRSPRRRTPRPGRFLDLKRSRDGGGQTSRAARGVRPRCGQNRRRQSSRSRSSP
jgi:hypothetical protein